MKKSSMDDAVKEVNKVVKNYKDLYDSSDDYSDEDVNNIINRFSMEKQIKQ
jgi:hypothetical protein